MKRTVSFLLLSLSSWSVFACANNAGEPSYNAQDQAAASQIQRTFRSMDVAEAFGMQPFDEANASDEEANDYYTTLRARVLAYVDSEEFRADQALWPQFAGDASDDLSDQSGGATKCDPLRNATRSIPLVCPTFTPTAFQSFAAEKVLSADLGCQTISSAQRGCFAGGALSLFKWMDFVRGAYFMLSFYRDGSGVVPLLCVASHSKAASTAPLTGTEKCWEPNNPNRQLDYVLRDVEMMQFVQQEMAPILAASALAVGVRVLTLTPRVAGAAALRLLSIPILLFNDPNLYPQQPDML